MIYVETTLNRNRFSQSFLFGCLRVLKSIFLISRIQEALIKGKRGWGEGSGKQRIVPLPLPYSETKE